MDVDRCMPCPNSGSIRRSIAARDRFRPPGETIWSPCVDRATVKGEPVRRVLLALRHATSALNSRQGCLQLRHLRPKPVSEGLRNVSVSQRDRSKLQILAPGSPETCCATVTHNRPQRRGRQLPPWPAQQVHRLLAAASIRKRDPVDKGQEGATWLFRFLHRCERTRVTVCHRPQRSAMASSSICSSRLGNNFRSSAIYIIIRHYGTSCPVR